MMKYRVIILSSMYSTKRVYEEEYFCLEDVISDINAFLELKGNFQFLPNPKEEHMDYGMGKGETIRIDIKRIV